MKLLELFSGTGSVGRVARDLGFSVISLDLKDANMNTDILSWDYKQFDVGLLVCFKTTLKRGTRTTPPHPST